MWMRGIAIFIDWKDHIFFADGAGSIVNYRDMDVSLKMDVSLFLLSEIQDSPHIKGTRQLSHY